MTALSSIPGLDAALANIQKGSTSGSDRTYADLPLDREFHATVTESEYKVASTGTPGIRYTLEVTDEGFENSKVWGSIYFTGHEMQGQQLAVFLTAAGAQADSIEEAGAKLVGGKVIIALQEEDNPNGGVNLRPRWINIDSGQAIRTGLKPKPKKGGSAALAATPNIVDQIKNQNQGSTTPVATPPAPAAPAPTPEAPAPAAAPPSGIKLPGMS